MVATTIAFWRSRRAHQRTCQGRPFLGIGPGADFVEQDTRLSEPTPREHADDVADMRGEGREALLDALLVTDVDEDRRRRRSSPSVVGRDEQPGLRHQASSPTVFRATVLPPVLGPVMSRTRKSSPSSRVIGTTVCWSSSGCRALSSRIRWVGCPGAQPVATGARVAARGGAGRVASIESARRALASARSIAAMASIRRPIASCWSPILAAQRSRGCARFRVPPRVAPHASGC